MSTVWSPDALLVRPAFRIEESALVAAIDLEFATYTTTRYIQGTGLNIATGRYTAPRRGLYHFDALFFFTHAATVATTLRINGDPARRNDLLTAVLTTALNEINSSLDVFLESGEYVSLWTLVLSAGSARVRRFSGHAL